MPSLKITNFRGMNTKDSDLGLSDEELRIVINAENTKRGSLRKSKGYSQAGDQLSSTTAQVVDKATGSFSSTRQDSSGNIVLTGGLISQTSHNDNHKVFGDNWIAQSFEATSTSITKVAAVLSKTTGSSLSLYDNFNDDSIDSAKWDTTGTVTETGGRLRVGGSSSGEAGTADTDGKTNGDPVKGVKLFFKWKGGGPEGPDVLWRLTNGTDYLEIRSQHAVNRTSLEAAGAYGSGLLKAFTGSSGTVEIKENGANIQVFVNGSLFYTISSTSIQPNTHLFVESEGNSGTADFYMELDNVEFYQDTTALEDLDVRIETDNSGEPSGTLVTNGSATIDDTGVTGTDDEVEVSFATSPTVVIGTTYWLVLKTDGGDSSNFYRVYKQNSDAYTDGSAFTSTDGGSNWSEDADAPSDLAFRIYGSYVPSGTWTSGNLTTESELSLLVINFPVVSSTAFIDRIDILDTSNVVKSSFTTDITSGTKKNLTASDFTSGFTFTASNSFRIRVTLASSSGTATPVVSSLLLNNPENKVSMLRTFYKGDGLRALMALVGSTLKRLVSETWVDVNTGLTTGLDSDATTFRATNRNRLDTGSVNSATTTSVNVDFTDEPGENFFQGKAIKIISGPGAGQVRMIQRNDGTTTSTTTSTSSSTSTSTTAT